HHGEGTPPLARIHARGQQTEEVAGSVARQLGVAACSPSQLITELAARPRPVGVVVDSLDEAASPAQLERDLLHGLAACPSVRLIVGVRSRSGSAPFTGPHVKLDLDGSAYFNPSDMVGYVFARLTTSNGKPASYAPEAAHTAARKVARFVAERAGK